MKRYFDEEMEKMDLLEGMLLFGTVRIVGWGMFMVKALVRLVRSVCVLKIAQIKCK